MQLLSGCCSRIPPVHVRHRIFSTALEVQDFCRREGWRFCFIGAVAVHEERIVTCGAEDLIVLKAFADREKDWLDIEGVLLRQGARLDERLIWRELEPLVELKEEPAISDRLTKLMERCR